MEVSWKQLIYGKLVQTVDGPIVAGKDHECTGMSHGIPSALQRMMTPSIVGPGTSDLTKWNEYIWNEQGGVAIQPIFVDGESWVVAGRIRGRSEKGEDKVGRYYTQAHYVTIPAKDYSPLSIFGLNKQLQANPMIEKDMALPELRIPIHERPLEEKWLEKIAPLLRITLSGIPFSIFTKRLSIQELTDVLQLVHLALPKALAWRMSIRIGSYLIKEGDVVLNSGQNIEGGPRMVGFYLDDLPKNETKIRSIQQAKKHLVDSDRLLGERYVDYLSVHMCDCTTNVELQAKIAAHFPHLECWDYFPITQSFEEVGIKFVHGIFEKDGLEKIESALRGTGEFPPHSFFHIYREQVLSRSCTEIFGCARDFVAQTITLWSDVWNELRLRDHDIARLYPIFFDGHVWDEHTAALLKQDIPDTFLPFVQKTMQGNIHALHLSSKGISCWIDLLESREGLSSWIRKEIESHEFSLFWIAMRYAKNGDERLLHCVQNQRPYMWYAELKKGGTSKSMDIKKLFAACPTDAHGIAAQEFFIGNVLKTEPIHGFMLLSYASSSLSMREKLDYPNVFDLSNGEEIARALCAKIQDGEDIPIELVRIALIFRSSLSADEQAALFSFVSQGISPWLGYLLFEQKTKSTGIYDDDARQIFIHEYKENIEMAFSLIERVYGLGDSKERESIKEELCRLFINDNLTPQCVYTKIAKELAKERAPSSKKITIQDADPDALSWFLTGWELSSKAEHIQNMMVLYAFARSVDEYCSLSQVQITKILSDSSLHKQWYTLAKQKKWESKEGWRIIAQWRGAPKEFLKKWSKTEQSVLIGLPAKNQLLCLASGMIFQGNWKQVSKGDAQSLEDADICIVLWSTLYTEDTDIQKIILLEALERLYKKDSAAFKTLKKEYTVSKSIFSSVWSSVGHLTKQISRSLSASIPENLTLLSVSSSILEGYGQEDAHELFSVLMSKQ